MLQTPPRNANFARVAGCRLELLAQVEAIAIRLKGLYAVTHAETMPLSAKRGGVATQMLVCRAQTNSLRYGHLPEDVFNFIDE